jgi:very-short-patch-repair endonuclease
MRYTEIDRRLEALAGKQYGAFTRKQAAAVGASDRFVARRLVERHWVRPVPGVFVLAASAPTWKRQCKIVELSVDGGAIGGRSALALHQLPDFRPGPIEVVVPLNAYCKHDLAITHRYTGAKLTTVEGITVTTVAQSLFDVALRLGPWRLERSMDEAILGKKASVDEFAERLDFYVGSRREGLPTIRPLVHERLENGWAPAESELEASLLATVARLPSHPMIVRQAPLPWRSARPGRVDVLLPAHRLIIEADGRRWHTRVADFDRDHWRDNQAVANGHRVMRFTWTHLNHLASEVIDLIEQTINGVTAASF